MATAVPFTMPQGPVLAPYRRAGIRMTDDPTQMWLREELERLLERQRGATAQTMQPPPIEQPISTLPMAALSMAPSVSPWTPGLDMPPLEKPARTATLQMPPGPKPGKPLPTMPPMVKPELPYLPAGEAMRAAGEGLPPLIHSPLTPPQQRGPAGPVPAGPVGQQPRASMSAVPPEDRDLLIRTVLGEAAGEPPEGQAGVAHVVLNRLKSGQYGGRIADVVLAPWQFEPWQTRADELKAIPPDSPAYQQAAMVVDAVLAGQAPDPTGGAMNFLSPGVMAQRGKGLPAWAQGPGLDIGGHRFFGGSQIATRPPETFSGGYGSAGLTGNPAYDQLQEAASGLPTGSQPQMPPQLAPGPSQASLLPPIPPPIPAQSPSAELPPLDVRSMLADYMEQDKWNRVSQALATASMAIGQGQPIGYALGAAGQAAGGGGMDPFKLMEVEQLQRQYGKDARDAEQLEAWIGTLPPELQAIARVNPGAVAGRQTEQLLPGPKDPIKASPGDTFIDPNTGQPMFSVPDAPQEWGPRQQDPMTGKVGQQNLKTGEWRYEEPMAAPGDEMQNVTYTGPDGQPVTGMVPKSQLAALAQQYPDARLAGAVSADAGGDPGKQFDQAAKLRDDFFRDTKDVQQAYYGYQKVVTGANNPSPAGDVAMIFGFMKTIDPGSTVREGEFATAQQTTNIPGQIVSMYNRAISGERLTEEQRADFARAAEQQFLSYRERYEGIVTQYTDIATRAGIRPEDVFVAIPFATQAPQQTDLYQQYNLEPPR